MWEGRTGSTVDGLPFYLDGKALVLRLVAGTILSRDDDSAEGLPLTGLGYPVTAETRANALSVARQSMTCPHNMVEHGRVAAPSTDVRPIRVAQRERDASEGSVAPTLEAWSSALLRPTFEGVDSLPPVEVGVRALGDGRPVVATVIGPTVDDSADDEVRTLELTVLVLADERGDPSVILDDDTTGFVATPLVTQ